MKVYYHIIQKILLIIRKEKEFEVLAENNKTGTIENHAESKYDNFYVIIWLYSVPND